MKLFSSKAPIRTSKRKSLRIPAYRAVEVYDDDGNLLEMGTLRDWSKQGALITLEKPRPLPKNIVIWFPQDFRGHEAELRWQEETSIGVSFDEEMERPDWLQHKKDRVEVVATHLLPAHERDAA